MRATQLAQGGNGIDDISDATGMKCVHGSYSPTILTEIQLCFSVKKMLTGSANRVSCGHPNDSVREFIWFNFTPSQGKRWPT